MVHQGPTVEPRPSASVLLVRGGSPWEVLMMRRPEGAEFAPGAYVFPGGSVHEEDRRFPDEVRAAAARELFEEVGILLARRGRRFARERDGRRLRALLGEQLGWPDALAAAGLEPAHDRLALLARWITPEPLRRRFDTRFYLARLPAGQTVHPQPGEVVDWMWVVPGPALADQRLALVYATRRILESVAAEPDPRRLFTRVRRRRTVQPVTPRLVQRDGGWTVEQ
jgi:8-oxo-dGTP pyrophosphatase MutT (NUDIX family)